MRSERADLLDPTQPSLLVTYGNTTRRVRPLDRELLVLGRAPACDINLVSPEVAGIHALILRAGEGWRVRDCGSRLGTRLNGRTVQECPLEDGDVLQIGSFSFHLNLPGKSAHGTSLRPDCATSGFPDTHSPLDHRRVRHLQRSRRHLAELALSLRRRCQAFRDQLAAVGHAERLAEERHADLARQQEALRGRQQELDAKAAQLLQLEEEVNARLSSLGQELADFQERQDRAEGRLAQCQAEVEARLRNIHEREAAVRETEAGFALAAAELQRLRAELETKQSELARREGEANGAGRPGADPSRVHVQPTATMLTKNEPAVDGSVTADALNHLHELERRGEELNHFARHLRRFRDQLAERERALALACERLEVLNPSRNLGPSGAP